MPPIPRGGRRTPVAASPDGRSGWRPDRSVSAVPSDPGLPRSMSGVRKPHSPPRVRLLGRVPRRRCRRRSPASPARRARSPRHRPRIRRPTPYPVPGCRSHAPDRGSAACRSWSRDGRQRPAASAAPSTPCRSRAPQPIPRSCCQVRRWWQPRRHSPNFLASSAKRLPESRCSRDTDCLTFLCCLSVAWRCIGRGFSQLLRRECGAPGHDDPARVRLSRRRIARWRWVLKSQPSHRARTGTTPCPPTRWCSCSKRTRAVG